VYTVSVFIIETWAFNSKGNLCIIIREKFYRNVILSIKFKCVMQAYCMNCLQQAHLHSL